jgi:hypothetical protein
LKAEETEVNSRKEIKYNYLYFEREGYTGKG